jgi:hypothetical protein
LSAEFSFTEAMALIYGGLTTILATLFFFWIFLKSSY